ncbi:hypothetical protein [Microbacterium sp. E-13]|uniref:hypothetical protein n=1 Tax=Microbacterium sp. E-13 TaxID=3404048 RepID=UPI003CF2938B
MFISRDNFEGLYPDGSGDSTAGLVAAINSVPEYGTAIIAPGTYAVSGPINGSRVNIRLIGYGATLLQIAKSPVISGSGRWGTPYAITRMTIVDEPSNDPSVGTGKSIKMTLQGTPPWRAGELIKLVSDDAIPESRTPDGATASRLGEYAVIKRTNGQTAYTVGLLREPFSANVRGVSVPADWIEVEGFTLRTADAGLSIGGGFGPLVTLTGLFRPRLINLRCPQAGAAVLQLNGCFAYLVDGVDIGYAANNTQSNPYQLGYGVYDNSSAYGTIQNSTFRYVRHAYTDDTPRIPAGTNEFWNLGRTYSTTVTNCHAIGTSGTAFDTHHASEQSQFFRCSAVNGGAGAAAFGLRGKRHIVSHCRAEGVEIGVSIFTEAERGGRSWGHRISEVRLINIAKTALHLNINPTGHPSANTRDAETNAFIDRIWIDHARWAIDAVNAKVEIAGATVGLGPGSATETYAIVRNRNSAITVADSRFDLRANTAGAIQYCWGAALASGAYNDVTLRRVTVQQSQSAAERADRFFIGDSIQATVDNVVFDYPLRIMPGSVTGNSSMVWRNEFNPSIARSDLSSAFHYFEGDVTAPLTAVWLSGDPHVTVQFKPSSSGMTLAPFGLGRMRAQRLTLLSTGSGTVVINHGSAARTRNITPAPVTLGADATASYFWDGSVWRQIS